jgi:transcriptional regulator with XRE-family HTH domain
VEIATAFGKVLRELRVHQKITQEALAAHAGLQRNYISLMERGYHEPTLSTVFAVATALRCSPLELVRLTIERASLSQK